MNNNDLSCIKQHGENVWLKIKQYKKNGHITLTRQADVALYISAKRKKTFSVQNLKYWLNLVTFR